MSPEDGAPELEVTHLGGPTVLLRLGGWTILTDPTFDPPGRRYGFGWGTSSTKTTGPALEPEDVGPVDVVLLSHEQHADNLDDRGRELLPSAGTVITTPTAARRLRSSNVVGLRPGETWVLDGAGRARLVVRATPCRHGPPLSRPLVGEVVGFAVSREGRSRVDVWMTGDTVLHGPVRELAETTDVDVLLLHLGRVRFPFTGAIRYSMDGVDAVRLLRLLRPRVAVPVHYEGWSHFSEQGRQLRDVLEGAGPEVGRCVRWLRPGVPTELGAAASTDGELQ